MSAPKYDYEFDAESSNNTAATVFRMAREGGSRVLDLGSGPAVVSSKLARELGFTVVCVDADAEALELARSRGVSQVVQADLSSDEWLKAVPEGPFDQIILADVLEHLFAPEALLSAIVEEGLLASNGQLLVSVPNASHESVLISLVSGEFEREDTGIRDRTHVQWFTLRSLQRLLEGAGFRVEAVERTTRALEQTSASSTRLDVPPQLLSQLRAASPEARTYQFVVRASLGSVREGLLPISAIDSLRREYDERVDEYVGVVRERAAQERSDLERALGEAKNESEQLREALTEAKVKSDEALRERDRLRSLVREERARASVEVRRSAEVLRTNKSRIRELTAERDHLRTLVERLREKDVRRVARIRALRKVNRQLRRQLASPPVRWVVKLRRAVKKGGRR